MDIFSKLETFIEHHYQIGELCMEYIKFDCQNNADKQCDHCEDNSWVGHPLHRVPKPFPDYNRKPEFHYLPVSETPADFNGKQRVIDDFQPRTQLKKLFAENKISLADDEKVTAFSGKYILEKKLVVHYLKHLQEMAVQRKKRLENMNIAKEKKEAQTYNDYDWVALFKDGKLKKLLNSELDKYLNHHQMEEFSGAGTKKQDKLQCIEAHIAKSLNDYLYENNEYDRAAEDKESSSSSGDDEVLAEIGSGSSTSGGHVVSSSSSTQENEQDNIDSASETDEPTRAPVQVSRTGRKVTTWRNRQCF